MVIRGGVSQLPKPRISSATKDLLGTLVVRTVVLGLLALQMSATVCYGQGGAVFSGRIVDKDSNPVADAEVTLQGEGYHRTFTGPNGDYEFVDSIKLGEYRLGIKSDDWVGITNYRDMPIIRIDPASSLIKNFTLEKACRIEVMVVDEDGNPLQSTLYCRPVAGDRMTSSTSNKTNAEGIATLGGLNPSAGKYLIGVTSSLHAMGHAVVEVSEPGKLVQKKITLRKGVTITGKAVCSDGEPPVGWRIGALPTWWTFNSYPAGVLVKEDGSFELQHIDDDRFNLTLSIPEGNGMSTSRSILSDAKLVEMQQPISLKIDYPSPKSMNYLTGTIRWIGKPLDGSIHITGYSAELRHNASHFLRAGATDFKVGPVPKGTYRIRPQHPDLEVMNLRKIKNLDDLDHVKVPNEEPLQLVLRVRGKPHVQGKVVDEKTRQPIPNFRYRVAKLQTLSGPNYVQESNWKVAKSPNGEFQTDVISPGVYSVSVLAEGYAIQSHAPVNTDEQPDVTLDFRLSAGVSLRGKIVDSKGNPIDGAKVRALSLTSGVMPRLLDRFISDERAAFSSDGHFELKDLQPGKDSLRVDHPDFALQEVRDIDVAEGSEALTIRMSKGATIWGTVYDAEGVPQPDVTLLFQDASAYGGQDREAGTFGRAVTDDHGRYEMRHLPQTTVYVCRAEEWSARGVVRHAVETTVDTTSKLDFGGTNKLAGRLMPSGQPLKNTRLQLGGTDSVFGGMKMFAVTDDDGEFCFYGPPAGHWTLYRALGERGIEWAKVRELDLAPSQELDLGDLRDTVGSLSVKCVGTAEQLSDTLSLELRAYSPYTYYGRPAALQKPRSQPEDPFVFLSVSQGDYELAGRVGNLTFLERIKLTNEKINTTIEMLVPTGDEKLSLEIVDENGEPLDDTFNLVSKDKRLNVALYPQMKRKLTNAYALTDLPAGAYSLHRGYVRNSASVADVVVVSGQENLFSVTLPKLANTASGRARLTVVDDQGVFVPCIVRLPNEVSQFPGATEITLTGAQGTYPLQIDQPGFKPVAGQVELKMVDPTQPLPTSSSEFDQVIRLERAE